jgi:glycosyltransferase involved in cell wall biosynthesis
LLSFSLELGFELKIIVKVMIFINALSALRGGGQTYLLHLLKRIPEHLHGKVIVLAHQKNQHIFAPYEKQIQVLVSDFASHSILHRMFFENFLLKQRLIKNNVEVFFSVSGLVPKWKLKQIRFVSVFQNQLPFAPTERKRYPYGYMRFKLLLLKFLQIQSLKSSDLCIFLTNYSQKVIESHVSQLPKQSVVIGHGLNQVFREKPKGERPKSLPEEYVLYVSNLDVYKAQLEVIQAWYQLKQKRETREKLILMGPEETYYGNKIRKLIEELGLEKEVLILESVAYEDIPSYYHYAKINIYASSCESYGIILLEKLAAGKPVFCSNFEPFPEIAGNSVEYFDPYQPNTLTTLFLKYLDDKSAMRQLGEKASHHAEKFDWADTASQTWKALELQMNP